MISVPERVKDALRDGRLLKNYRFNVLETDGTVDFTIDNDTLVYESVKFDERMCSGDTLKFGLCEGSSLEFQYFDHPNITGRQIQCFIDVQYIDAAGDPAWQSIPMGFFTVKKCSRQASTGIQKVTAYNKLQSEYLDAKANETLTDLYDPPINILHIYDIKKTLLSDYEVSMAERKERAVIFSMTGESRVLKTFQLFNSSVGIDRPINRYSVDQRYASTSQTYYLRIQHLTFRWNIGGNTSPPVQLEEIIHDLHDLQSTYIDFLKDICVRCQWNWDDFKNSMLNKFYYGGFDFYINNGQYGLLIPSRYSDYAYYEEGRTTFSTYSNLLKTILVSKDIKEFGNDLNLYFYVPYRIIVRVNDDQNSEHPASGSTIVQTLNLYGNNAMTYAYTEQGDTTSIPPLKYPNGDNIPDPYASGNVNPDYIFDNWLDLYELNIPAADLIVIDPQDLPDYTLRDITNGTYELLCQYGQLDRETDLFSGVELNHTALYPADTLYPANDLYPGGVSETSFRSWYSKLWTDTVGEQSFRNLIITYKGLDGNNVPTDFVYETVVDPDGTTDYIMDDNWLFRNLIWTQQQIEDYADAMVTKMQNIHWFPFEMWAAGLPYIETGDMIEIIAGDETHTSYVLQRQLSGIQNLQDTYINGTLDIF